MSARSFVVYGLHACRAALERAPQDVLEIWLRQDTSHPELGELSRLAAELGLRTQAAAPGTLERLTDGGVHQGIALRRRTPPARALAEVLERPSPAVRPLLLLVLDQAQDPHNLGACLRVADGAGAAAVVVPRDRSAGVTGVVAKAASGALDSVPLVAVPNLARALDELKAAGLWVVGATHEAHATLYETDLRGPLAWVLGGEGGGLRRLTRERCDGLARIPLHGAVSSLNVSTAAAVCLFEAVRQRGQPPTFTGIPDDR